MSHFILKHAKSFLLSDEKTRGTWQDEKAGLVLGHLVRHLKTDPNHGIQTLNRKESAKLKSKPERTSRILELLNDQKEEIEAALCIHEEACGSIQSEIDRLKVPTENCHHVKEGALFGMQH